MFPSGANDKGAEREPGPLNFLRPRMRIGVDRFQSTGADVGTNFRRLFNLELGAYHTEASFSLILTVLRWSGRRVGCESLERWAADPGSI
jgi:hypothetical protein